MMNEQRNKKIQTCLWVLGISLSVYILHILVLGIIVIIKVAFFDSMDYMPLDFFLATHKFPKEEVAHFQRGLVKRMEWQYLLGEILVAIFIIKRVLEYAPRRKKSYSQELKRPRWDDTTYLYIGFAILSFVGLLLRWQDHLLHSCLDVIFNKALVATFPRDRLLLSQIRWVIVVPLYTEMLYRGFIFSRCKDSHLSSLECILINAVGFALLYPKLLPYDSAHFMVPGIWRWYSYKFMLGFTLAAVYQRTQRLDVTIMLHSLHNFLMCFFDLNSAGMAVMFWQGVPLLLMLGVQSLLCSVNYIRTISFSRSGKPKALVRA